MAWMNDDGLYIKYGTEEGHSAHKAGTFGAVAEGSLTVIEVVIDATLLTQTETILNDTVWVPANAQIMWVQTECVVALTDGTAIDVGLIKNDRETELDYNGFLEAFPTAEAAQVGETRRFYETHTVPTSMTGTGALIGQEISERAYISASMTDATGFGAGKLRVKVAYVPKGIDVP